MQRKLHNDFDWFFERIKTIIDNYIRSTYNIFVGNSDNAKLIIHVWKIRKKDDTKICQIGY